MWEIRGEDLSLELSEGGLTLKGRSSVLKDALDIEWAGIFEVELDDLELHRMADAIDEYFAGQKL